MSAAQDRVALRAARFAAVADLREAARRALPGLVFDYLEGGSEDEVALRRNLDAWNGLALVPRAGRDVAVRSAQMSLWGETWSMPFGVAPTGLAGLIRPDADTAIARAAFEAGVPFVLSTTATTSIEAIAAVNPRFWFQLYMPADRAVGHDLVRRAAEAGASVLVVTLDVPAPGWRERDLRRGFRLPFRLSSRMALDFARHPGWAWRMARAAPPRFASLAPYAPEDGGSLAGFMARQITADLTWDEVARLRERWKGRIVAKGVLAPDDVRLAAGLGLDGVILSNHGGRQVGLAAAPIDLLPEAVAASGGRLAVMLDGGVRRGSHIAAAVALGASMVFAGRPTLYGVAVAGGPGAARALSLLRAEFDRALAMLGAASPDRLEPGMVRMVRSGGIAAS